MSWTAYRCVTSVADMTLCFFVNGKIVVVFVVVGDKTRLVVWLWL